MRKTIFTLLTAVVLLSCQKEVSYEQSCGIITKIDYLQKKITVNYSGNLVSIPVGLLFINNYKVGDTYCK